MTEPSRQSAKPARPSHLPTDRPGSFPRPELLLRGLRHAARALARGRGFTVTVLLTLALCMGAAVAAFSVFESVVLKPLPFPDADQLVKLTNSYPGAGVERASNGVPDYYDRKRDVKALAELAVYRGSGRTLLHDQVPERLDAMIATPSLFSVLGVHAERGRLFNEEDGEPGHEMKVLLTHELWQRLFDGDDSVLGTDLRLDGKPYTIVGVLPAGFAVPPFDAALVVPAAFTAEDRADDKRHSNSWQMLGRLAPGASLEQVQSQVDALNARNLELFPALKPLLIDAKFHTLALDFQGDLIRDIRPKLALLLGGALFVLLIGCVNIANLVLVRTTARYKELATRCALGAGRARLAGQLMVENVLLALAGGGLGLAAGAGALRLLATYGADRIPRGAEIGIDGGVVLLTFAVALVIGCVLGTIPVVQILRRDLSTIFREEGRTGSSGRGAVVTRNLLVGAQVAFAFVLLIGAGFLLASFIQMLGVDLGFVPDGVITANISLPEARYPDDAAQRAFDARLLDQVRALPSVAAAGITDTLPFTDHSSSSVITVEGYELKPGESVRSPYHRSVSPGYFEAMGIKLRRGRVFDARDTADSQKVAVVDRWLAEKYWPGRDPIGGRLYLGVPEMMGGDHQPTWRTVVGVVDDIRVTDPSGDQTEGAYYFPETQQPNGFLSLVVSVKSGDPTALVPNLRNVLRGIDPELPLDDVQTMGHRIGEKMAATELPMLLAAGFAGIALFLAAIGIYGVLAYSVLQRTRELGIRVALGSTSGEVFRLVLGQGLAILGMGLAAGLVGSFFLTRWMESLLYGVSPFDPAVFLAVAGLLSVVAFVATAVPALRATRVDPVVALAAE